MRLCNTGLHEAPLEQCIVQLQVLRSLLLGAKVPMDPEFDMDEWLIGALKLHMMLLTSPPLISEVLGEAAASVLYPSVRCALHDALQAMVEDFHPDDGGVKVNALLRCGLKPEEAAKEAVALVARGYKCIKVKVCADYLHAWEHILRLMYITGCTGSTSG